MRLEGRKESAARKLSGRRVSGRCLCGAVELEIDFPAFWAWHDHSADQLLIAAHKCERSSVAKLRCCPNSRLSV